MVPCFLWVEVLALHDLFNKKVNSLYVGDFDFKRENKREWLNEFASARKIHKLWVSLVWIRAGLVRFPDPLTIGSGSGFQYPKKWEIFLWGHLAQPFDNAEGWVGAYWVRTDLDLTWHQSWISTFTQCCCSGAFMSSAQSSLCPPPNPHFASTHWIVVFWP